MVSKTLLLVLYVCLFCNVLGDFLIFLIFTVILGECVKIPSWWR